MNTRYFIGIMFSVFCAIGLIGCSKDEEGFSKEEIQQAIYEMKGTYYGTVHVSSSQGLDLTLQNATAISRDSLKFKMSLQPLAEVVSDKAISERLYEIGEVEVSAGYQFYQRNESVLLFSLCPTEIIVWGGFGAPPTVRIVFSLNYGGNAEVDKNFMTFNISPTELWINGEKYEEFPKITYHFEGVYE